MDAFQFVLDTLTASWNWLLKWGYHGVSFGMYIVGFIILSMMIDRIFR